MRIDDVKALAEVLKKYDLSAIETTNGDYTVRVERQIQVVGADASPMVQAASVGAAPVASEQVETLDDDVFEVKSPMVGVFYAAPSPDAEPFVAMGKQIKKGDVLCIVEAMKLMNEIVAEADGQIVDICVANGQVVEFGQELFKLRKSNEG